MVSHLGRTTVGADVALQVAHGRVLDREVLRVGGEGPWAVLDEQGALLAVYEAAGPTRLRPAVVMTGG